MFSESREKDQKHAWAKAKNHVGQGVVIAMLLCGGTVPKRLAGNNSRLEISSKPNFHRLAMQI